MTDIDKLERLAKAATPGEWIARADGWTIRAYVGNELAADGVKVAHTCAMMMQGQGSKPDIEQQVANQEFIATANPTEILGLVAEVRRLRERDALLFNVCHYADSVCGMLRQGGWPGKAEALGMRIKAVIDFDKENQ